MDLFTSNRVKEYWGIRTLKELRALGGRQNPSTNPHSISTLNIIFVVEPLALYLGALAQHPEGRYRLQLISLSIIVLPDV
jgi:hypothetical protein